MEYDLRSIHGSGLVNARLCNTSSTAQLQELLQNPVKFADFFETLDSVMALNETRDSLYEEVERLARKNCFPYRSAPVDGLAS